MTIILGIVPSNKDPFLSDRSEFSNNQIQILRNLQDLPNVLIFQHGYSHLPNPALNKLRIKSETFLLTYDNQLKLVQKGKHKLESMQLNPVGYMPPYHGYDNLLFKVCQHVGYKYICTNSVSSFNRMDSINQIPTIWNYARFYNFFKWLFCLIVIVIT